MPARSNPTGYFNPDPEDTHDASLADESECNTSVTEGNGVDPQEDSTFFQDAIASGEEPQAMPSQEAHGGRVDDPVMNPRLVPFPSQRRTNPPEGRPRGYFYNPANLTNPWLNRSPTGAPTQPAERPILWDDASLSPFPTRSRFPTVAPTAASFAARASRLNSRHRPGVNGSPFPPPPTPPACLAYSSTARLVRSNNPSQQHAPAGQMLNHHQPPAAPAAAVPTSTGHATQGGQASLFHAEQDPIDALQRERAWKRLGYSEANRVGHTRRRGGVRARRSRRHHLGARFRGMVPRRDTSFDDMIRSNQASVDFAQDLAQRFMSECLERHRAERAARQQGNKDGEEGQEPASTNGDEEDPEPASATEDEEDWDDHP